jgi:hypothetical protein
VPSPPTRHPLRGYPARRSRERGKRGASFPQVMHVEGFQVEEFEEFKGFEEFELLQGRVGQILRV